MERHMTTASGSSKKAGGRGTDASEPLVVLTAGHSNQALEDLIDRLRRHRVEAVVDARSQPYSRYSPHFGRESLERAVRRAAMQYLFMGDTLGGRPSDRACYNAEGKVQYDWVEEQEFYRKGIERLLSGIARYRVCLLCSEEDPIRCHRRLLVGRTLQRRGVFVQHIRREGGLESEEEVQAPGALLGEANRVELAPPKAHRSPSCRWSGSARSKRITSKTLGDEGGRSALVEKVAHGVHEDPPRSRGAEAGLMLASGSLGMR
jgi:hypothetical protein